MPKYIRKRPDGRYRLSLRVPTELVEIVGKRFYQDSLHADDEAVALAKAHSIVAELKEGWDSLRSKNANVAERHFERAKVIAKRHGLPYRENLSRAPVEENIDRVEIALGASEKEAAALMGGFEEPTISISDLVDQVEHIQRVELSTKTPQQLKRWRLARTRAAKNLITVIGEDLPITHVARDNALDFRDWWADRLLEEGLSAGSANKDIQHLSTMIRTISRALRLETQDPFVGLRFQESASIPPHSLTPTEVSLALSQSNRLNEAATTIVEVLAQTGLRPTEAINNVRYDIDHDIPNVTVGRMKTKNAARQVPLVGRALEAVRANPEAFKTYEDREATFCALTGKWLRSIFPDTPRVRPYSFRHGFQDRLIAIEAPERLQADLMGHSFHRERYGSGPSLEQKREWLLKTAIS